MPLRIVAIVCGSLCGLGLFFGLYNPKPVYRWHYPAQKYSGSVITHDSAHKRIVIQILSEFPVVGTTTEKVQFIYDDRTQWLASGFIFKDGILEARRSAESKPIALPEGLLVSIVRDIGVDGPLRAADIIVLHRTEL